MARLDNRADEPRYPDAVRAGLNRYRLSIRSLDCAIQGFGILLSEEEDVTDLDATAGEPPAFRQFRKFGRFVLLLGRCIFRGEVIDDFGDRRDIVIVDVEGAPIHVVKIAIKKNLAFAGV